MLQGHPCRLPKPKRPLESDAGGFVSGAGSHHVLFNGSKTTRFSHHVPSRPDTHGPFNATRIGLQAGLALCSRESHFISVPFLWI